jgi:N-acetylglucosaminyl-diphospho-decaprenol L-rhamnosyltransferase
MDLSIIIVNWNTRDLLCNCLRSIESHSGPAEVQVIVVDNHSSDCSREMVAREFPRVTLINSGGNVGFAKANNIGLLHAKAPLILFLNPDTEIRGDGLERMIRVLRADRSIGALGCKIRNLSGTLQPLGLQWFPSPLTELVKFIVVSDQTSGRLARILPVHDAEKSGHVVKLFGACLLVRKSVLDQVGSFDERFFMYCEDVDLCHRITSAGWRLFYLAEAEILHLGASASSKVSSSFSVLMMCESFSKFMRKHHGQLGGAAYRVVALLGSSVRLLALGALRAVAFARRRGDHSGLSASFRKYLMISKWCLGLQKAVVGN